MDESGKPADIGRTACGGKLKDTQGFPSALYGGERIYSFATRPAYAFSNSLPTCSWQVKSSIPEKTIEVFQNNHCCVNRLWSIPEPVFYIGKKAYKKTGQTALCLQRDET